MSNLYDMIERERKRRGFPLLMTIHQVSDITGLKDRTIRAMTAPFATADKKQVSTVPHYRYGQGGDGVRMTVDQVVQMIHRMPVGNASCTTQGNQTAALELGASVAAEITLAARSVNSAIKGLAKSQAAIHARLAEIIEDAKEPSGGVFLENIPHNPEPFSRLNKGEDKAVVYTVEKIVEELSADGMTALPPSKLIDAWEPFETPDRGNNVRWYAEWGKLEVYAMSRGCYCARVDGRRVFGKHCGFDTIDLKRSDLADLLFRLGHASKDLGHGVTIQQTKFDPETVEMAQAWEAARQKLTEEALSEAKTAAEKFAEDLKAGKALIVTEASGTPQRQWTPDAVARDIGGDGKSSHVATVTPPDEVADLPSILGGPTLYVARWKMRDLVVTRLPGDVYAGKIRGVPLLGGARVYREQLVTELVSLRIAEWIPTDMTTSDGQTFDDCLTSLLRPNDENKGPAAGGENKATSDAEETTPEEVLDRKLALHLEKLEERRKLPVPLSQIPTDADITFSVDVMKDGNVVARLSSSTRQPVHAVASDLLAKLFTADPKGEYVTTVVFDDPNGDALHRRAFGYVKCVFFDGWGYLWAKIRPMSPFIDPRSGQQMFAFPITDEQRLSRSQCDAVASQFGLRDAAEYQLSMGREPQPCTRYIGTYMSGGKKPGAVSKDDLAVHWFENWSEPQDEAKGLAVITVLNRGSMITGNAMDLRRLLGELLGVDDQKATQ